MDIAVFVFKLPAASTALFVVVKQAPLLFVHREYDFEMPPDGEAAKKVDDWMLGYGLVLRLSKGHHCQSRCRPMRGLECHPALPSSFSSYKVFDVLYLVHIDLVSSWLEMLFTTASNECKRVLAWPTKKLSFIL